MNMAMNTDDESYVCDLEFAFEQPLASRSAKCEFAFARGNLWHPTVQAGVHALGGNCWHGIGSTVQVYPYNGRQALARKYDYTRITVGKECRIMPRLAENKQFSHGNYAMFSGLKCGIMPCVPPRTTHCFNFVTCLFDFTLSVFFTSIRFIW